MATTTSFACTAVAWTALGAAPMTLVVNPGDPEIYFFVGSTAPVAGSANAPTWNAYRGTLDIGGTDSVWVRSVPSVGRVFKIG